MGATDAFMAIPRCVVGSWRTVVPIAPSVLLERRSFLPRRRDLPGLPGSAVSAVRTGCPTVRDASPKRIVLAGCARATRIPSRAAGCEVRVDDGEADRVRHETGGNRLEAPTAYRSRGGCARDCMLPRRNARRHPPC